MDRRKIYIDSKIQGVLLVALIVLELSLVGGATGFIYIEFLGIVDARLYRTHAPENDPSILIAMAWAFGEIITILIVINILALIAADLVWRRYVNSIIFTLSQCVEKLGKLDFQEQNIDVTKHHSLELILHWKDLKKAQFSLQKKRLNELELKAQPYLKSQNE